MNHTITSQFSKIFTVISDFPVSDLVIKEILSRLSLTRCHLNNLKYFNATATVVTWWTPVHPARETKHKPSFLQACERIFCPSMMRLAQRGPIIQHEAKSLHHSVVWVGGYEYEQTNRTKRLLPKLILPTLWKIKWNMKFD